MQCKLLHDTPAAPTIPPNKDLLPKGMIINHPNAWILVQIGAAEPWDDECREKTNRTAEQLAAAQYEYTRTRRGIHPDDFNRYDRGELIGYNADGSEVPGPNFIEPEEEDEEEEEEYEDDE